MAFFYHYVPHNPKHVKRKVAVERRKTFKQNKIPSRYILMGIIFVIVAAGVSLAAIFWNSADGNNNNNEDNDGFLTEVIDGCWVQMEYKIYYDKNNDGEIDISTTVDLHDSKTEADLYTVRVTEETMLLGWYEGILGMKKGDSEYINIEAFIDEDSDGRNDESGNPPMGFVPTSSLAYKELIIYAKIILIISAEDYDPNTFTNLPPIGSYFILPQSSKFGILAHIY